MRPQRLLQCIAVRSANSTIRWSRGGNRVSKLAAMAARSTFTRMSSAKSVFMSHHVMRCARETPGRCSNPGASTGAVSGAPSSHCDKVPR